jgi:NAD(P)-dependent dehydrogenase (short-subunit alcohol dehydrogenase family)
MEAARLFDIRGHVAVVTGAATGIGRALAEVMATNGAQVVIADINGEGAETAATELRERGLAAVAATVDVTDRAGLVRLMDGVASRHGRLDIVFANAGIAGGVGPAEPGGEITAIDPELWERVLRTNLTGVLSTIQAAVPHMKQRQYGRIIVTASGTGLRGHQRVGTPYVTSKAAVVNLVRQAALELIQHKILVNAMAPGPIRTNILGHRPPDPAREAASRAATVYGRLGEAHELMGLALLLASPAASYMTGSIVVIDGGETAR